MALFSKDSAPTPSAPPTPRRDSSPQIQGAATLIGANVAVDGTITGSTPVVVEGTVRGKIDLGADLLVGTKARVEAAIHARNVVIEGKVTGDVSADQRVELVPTAWVDGNIKAPKIVVAEGATFRGSVDMGSKAPREGADAVDSKGKS